MAGEFTKATTIKPAVVGTIANPDEYNQNIAGQSKGAIVGIDVDGNFDDVDIGDESLGGNGTLINDIKIREGGLLKFYNASGVFQSSAFLGQATETQIGQAEISTQTEADTGTDDNTIITPLKLKTRQGRRYVGRLTASSSSQLSQTLSTGKAYEFELNYITPATDGGCLVMQVSTNGGSSWSTSSYNSVCYYSSQADGWGGVVNNASRFSLTKCDNDANVGLSNSSTRGGWCGNLYLFDPANTTKYKKSYWEGVFVINSAYNYIASSFGYGAWNSSTAVNAVRFIMKTANSDTNKGNIASGYIDVWEVNA